MKVVYPIRCGVDAIHITVANPKWVKAVKGSKDDTKDSSRHRCGIH